MSTLCGHPYTLPSGLEVRCGRCMPCRIYQQEVWVCRGILEAMVQPVSSFLTLTYSPEKFPPDGNLSVPTWQAFARRLRKVLAKSGSTNSRYLAVGEYGSQTWRPHYHALWYGQTTLDPEQVREAWGLGHVQVGTVSTQSVRYCCGYTTKRLTVAGDVRLQGRAPEFMRSSRRPGLGVPAIPTLAAWYFTDQGSKWLAQHRDVLPSIRFDGRRWALGRHLLGKLREAVGVPPQDPERLQTLQERIAEEEAKDPDYSYNLAARRERSLYSASNTLANRRAHAKL